MIRSHEGYERAIARNTPRPTPKSWWTCGRRTGHKLPAAFEYATAIYAAHVGEQYLLLAMLPKEKPYGGVYVVGAILSPEAARQSIRAITPVTPGSTSRSLDTQWGWAAGTAIDTTKGGDD